MKNDIYTIADRSLELIQSLGADYAEVYAESSFSKSFAVEQGVVNGEGYFEDVGLRCRFIKNNSLYTFSTNELELGTVKRLMHRFRDFKGANTKLSEEYVLKVKYMAPEKKKVENAHMLPDLLALDNELKTIKYVKFRSLYGSVSRTKSYFINSEGTSIEDGIPMVGSFLTFIVGEGRRTRQRFMQFGGVGGYELFDSDSIGKKLRNEAKNLHDVAKDGIALTVNQMKKIKNVVISPEIAGIAVHESIGHANEADRVYGREAAQAGLSYLTKDSLGMRIGSDAVTVVDDPTVRMANGFYLFDDEGVRAVPKVIIKNGIQNELLVNREYGGRLNRKSNAAARSESYYNEPIVRMSNTYLKAGDAALDELFEEAGDGIYIKSFMEWNIDDTRSFSRYQGNEAYIIRNGRLGKPVTNFVLESNTLDFWKAVKMVGNEFELYLAVCGKGEPSQGVPVSMGGASALLSFS